MITILETLADLVGTLVRCYVQTVWFVVELAPAPARPFLAVAALVGIGAVVALAYRIERDRTGE